jgi:Nucleotidyltransferase domain
MQNKPLTRAILGKFMADNRPCKSPTLFIFVKKNQGMITQSPVTQSVKQVLQHLYGERLARLVLFGSYARGDQREDSDMDF